MTERFDIIIIGGGIAGAACAAELAASRKVLLLERESQLGAHSSGRSAALYTELYGNNVIRALTAMSRSTLFETRVADGVGLVSKRGILFIAKTSQTASLDTLRASPQLPLDARDVSSNEATLLCPILRIDQVNQGLLEPGGADIDVDLMLQHYASRLRQEGGKLVTGAEVHALERIGTDWLAIAETRTYSAPIVVNAAGAWADKVASIAGLSHVGIQPYRRTAVVVDVPAGADVKSWPCVIDVDEEFYFKPFGAGLMVSPADETPCEPHDVQPEELDIAIAVDRLEQVTNLRVRRIVAKWAGLRSFAADRTPVVGFDPSAEGFFWLAGQGGYGIQTAPALARLAAALLVGDEPTEAGHLTEALSPVRFRHEPIAVMRPE